MVYDSERRRYIRNSEHLCIIMSSIDRVLWSKVELMDISAGGIKISTKKALEEKSEVYIDVLTYNENSEFNLSFKGKIVRKQSSEKKNIYGIEFLDPNLNHQNQLNNIINSRIGVFT